MPTIDAAFDVHRDPAETLANDVARELGDPAWLFVERKGPSVAFHVRQAEDVAAARAAVVAPSPTSATTSSGLAGDVDT